MVREVVVIGFEAGDGSHIASPLNHDGDESCAIGLKCQWLEVKEQVHATDEVFFVLNVFRRLRIDLRLGFLHPRPGFLHSLLHLPHRGEVFVQLVAIRTAETLPEPLGLLTHGVHDAAAFVQFAHLCSDLFRSSVQEELGKE